MSNISLKNNAYQILGLDTSASEKEILKRSKEIINRLKIDDYPEYDLDVDVFKDSRTVDSVKEALQNLQAPKKRIREYFFWFQIADSIDEQAIGLLKRKDYLNAIRTWQTAADGETTKAYLYRKNLAILYCIVLSIENNSKYLHNSVTTWKSILDSDKFWSAFAKIYKLHDEQTASDEVVADFKKHVVEYLSDIYTELHDLHRDAEYIQNFQSVFSTKSKKMEKNVLNPVYQTIHTAVEKLEKMTVSEDRKFDNEEAEQIKQNIGSIQLELNKLVDLGLFDDSQTKIMRDRAATALHTIVLDLHNNLSEIEKSLKLLEVAVQIAGTEGLKNKLEAELEQIKKNLSEDAENTLKIEVPGTFGGGTVVFKNSYIEYNNTRIFYKDVTSISYHAVNQSINFIPISQTFNFMVASDKEKISFSFGTTLHIGAKEKRDVWAKLAGIAAAVIEPVIVKKIVDKVFDRGEAVNIGGVEFTKDGFSRTKFFGGKETVPWTDTIYIPKLAAGNVAVFRDDAGKATQFATMAMSVPNAVVLPELMQAFHNRTH